MFEQLEGLSVSPRPIHLFVDLHKDEQTGDVTGWHVFVGQSKKAIQIHKPALTGKLDSIRMRIKEFQNKQNYKVEFNVRSGDRRWVIRSGVETFFTRGVILQLEKIENLGAFPEITFLTEAGETTVRGSIWIGGDQVRAEWDAEVPLFSKITELQRRLGQEPQTVESIKADFEREKQGQQQN